MSVAEVSEALGYNGASAFVQWFRHTTRGPVAGARGIQFAGTVVGSIEAQPAARTRSRGQP